MLTGTGSRILKRILSVASIHWRNYEGRVNKDNETADLQHISYIRKGRNNTVDTEDSTETSRPSVGANMVKHQ
jgi:hypothetical protein